MYSTMASLLDEWYDNTHKVSALSSNTPSYTNRNVMSSPCTYMHSRTTRTNTLNKVYSACFNYTHNTSPPPAVICAPPPSPQKIKPLPRSSLYPIQSLVVDDMFSTEQVLQSYSKYNLMVNTNTLWDDGDILYLCPIVPRSMRHKVFTFDEILLYESTGHGSSGTCDIQ